MIACQLVNQQELDIEGPVSDIILKIPSMLSEHPNWSYVRAPREHNEMAHRVAHWAAAECRRGPVPFHSLPVVITFSYWFFEPR